MFSFVFPYGYPFDPTKDEFFSEPSSSGRITGELKKATKSNLGKKDDDVLLGMFDQLFIPNKYKLDILDTNLFISNVDKSKFSVETKRHLSLLSKLSVKRKNRYFLANDDMYIEAVKASYKGRESNYHDNFKLINAGIFIYSKNILGITDYFDKKQCFPIIDKYAGKIEFSNKELARIVFSLKMKASLYSYSDVGPLVMATIMEMAFSDLEKRKNIKESIACLWSMSRFFNNPNIFYFTYYFFSELFSSKDFPFLRLSVLESSANKIMNDDTIIENYISLSITEELKKILASKSSESGHKVLSDIFSNREAFIDKAKETRRSIDRINNNFYSFLDVVNLFDESAYINFKDGFSGVSIKAETRLSSDILGMLEKEVVARLENLTYDLDKDGKLKNNYLKLNEKVEILEERSMVLAKKPLDNIGELNDLSKEKIELDSKIHSLKAEIDNIVQSIFSGFNDLLTYCEKYISDELEKEKSVLSDYEIMEIALSDNEKLHDKEKTYQEKINKLEEKLSDLQRDKDRNVNAIRNISVDSDKLSDIMLAINSGTSSIRDVLLAVMIINDGNILIEDSLLDSVSSNKEFQKHELLFKKLLLLTSNKFLEEYAENGSIGCFSLFTKTELSFQESKATQKVHPRIFTVGNKEYDCKAHIKIGADNTEQNMLRVYFAIDSGKLVIGDIVKHLPIVRKI